MNLEEHVGQESLSDQQLLGEVGLLQLPEEVQSLLHLPHVLRDVCGPGELAET